MGFNYNKRIIHQALKSSFFFHCLFFICLLLHYTELKDIFINHLETLKS